MKETNKELKNVLTEYLDSVATYIEKLEKEIEELKSKQSQNLCIGEDAVEKLMEYLDKEVSWKLLGDDLSDDAHVSFEIDGKELEAEVSMNALQVQINVERYLENALMTIIRKYPMTIIKD